MAWETTPTITSSNQKLKNVAVCMPHTGFLHTEFIERTYIPLRLIPVPFCNKIPISAKAYGVTVARNSLIHEAIKYDADYILWVDTDMVVESVGKQQVEIQEKLGEAPKQVTKLMETNDANAGLKVLFDIMEKNPSVNLLSGLYRAKKAEGFHYAAWLKVQDKPLGFVPIGDFTGNFIEVDVIGLGFALERVEPLKTMAKPWFHWDDSTEPSEDFDHCIKLAKQTGKKIHVYTDLRLSHIGDLVVKSDSTFRVRQA